MQTWRAVCMDGYTKEVSAASREEAYKMFRKNQEILNHMKKKHPELKGKTVEHKDKWVLALVQLVV